MAYLTIAQKRKSALELDSIVTEFFSSRSDFARAVGATRQEAYDWSIARRPIPRQKALRLAELLGHKIDIKTVRPDL